MGTRQSVGYRSTAVSTMAATAQSFNNEDEKKLCSIITIYNRQHLEKVYSEAKKASFCLAASSFLNCNGTLNKSLALWLNWLNHSMCQDGRMIPAVLGSRPRLGHWYNFWCICYEIDLSSRYRGFAVVLSNVWTVIASFHWGRLGNSSWSMIADELLCLQGHRGLCAGPTSGSAKLGW